MSVPWSIPGSDSQPILGDTHAPPPSMRPRATLLLLHGFKGYKDYGFFPLLADRAAQRGLIAHRFNFSHSGMTNRLAAFERPDLFQRDTWSKQVFDLQAVAAAKADPDLPLIIYGHSRGGVVAILAAARCFNPDFFAPAFPGQLPIQPAAIITAASPHYACNLDDTQRRVLHQNGYIPSPSLRTGQQLRIGLPWLEEIEHFPERHDPVLAASCVLCPMLIIHGEADQTVPVASAQSLAAAAPNARLIIVPAASHTFNCPNPLPSAQEPPPQTRQLIDLICNFALKKY